MRFIFPAVLLMTSVSATELIQQHNTSTYKRTDFEHVINYYSKNINNKYDAYKFIELISTGKGTAGDYSFNGVGPLGTYEEHDKAFKLLQKIGNTYGSNFYISHGDNYDFVRTALNFGALNRWFEENKGLIEERNKTVDAVNKLSKVLGEKINNKTRDAFNEIKEDSWYEKSLKYNFTDEDVKKKYSEKEIEEMPFPKKFALLKKALDYHYWPDDVKDIVGAFNKYEANQVFTHATRLNGDKIRDKDLASVVLKNKYHFIYDSSIKEFVNNLKKIRDKEVGSKISFTPERFFKDFGGLFQVLIKRKPKLIDDWLIRDAFEYASLDEEHYLFRKPLNDPKLLLDIISGGSNALNPDKIINLFEKSFANIRPSGNYNGNECSLSNYHIVAGAIIDQFSSLFDEEKLIHYFKRCIDDFELESELIAGKITRIRRNDNYVITNAMLEEYVNAEEGYMSSFARRTLQIRDHQRYPYGENIDDVFEVRESIMQVNRIGAFEELSYMYKTNIEGMKKIFDDPRKEIKERIVKCFGKDSYDELDNTQKKVVDQFDRKEISDEYGYILLGALEGKEDQFGLFVDAFSNASVSNDGGQSHVCLNHL